MKQLITFCVLLSLALPAIALAGDFDDPFTYFYEKAGPDDVISAMVFLTDRYDARQVSTDMAEAGFTSAQRHEEVIVGLKDVATRTQAPIIKLLDSFGADVAKVRPFWIANAIEVHAKKHVFEKLADRGDVNQIRAIPEIETIEPVAASPATDSGKGVEGGITSSRAPELWAMGFTGTTALACDVDTGADGDHEAFGDRWRGHDSGVTAAETWFDPVTSTTFPFDPNNHGSHTLGTMVGDDGGDNQIGMAPGAKWIAAGVIDRVDIATTYSDAYAAFQWAADPDDNPATTEDVPDVINNSWGLQPMWHGYSECDDYMWDAMDGAEAAGVVVVFAAGNEGYYGASSLRVPGDRNTTTVNAFAVGALNQDNTTIAGFSSLGPSTCSGSNTIKPEVSAVGVDVRSANKSGGYMEMSGTSMATPHVAGAVLLLRDAFPEATVEDVKLAIYNSADDLGTAGEDNTFGMGALDVVDAFDWLCANGYGDVDNDTYMNATCGGNDCDDSNADINPGADEVCNGVDDNCVNGIDEGGDDLCDDELYCNGTETCDGTNGCQADDTEICPDDGTFCNGAESCDEDTDSCISAGDPCADDGEYCNGTESCDEDNDSCNHSGDPCGDDETCNEASDSCDPAGDDDDAVDDDDATDDDATDDDDSGSDDDDDDSSGGICD